MLDTKALQQLVEQQVKEEVAVRVSEALNEQWIKSVEDNAIKFIQDRIVGKFANSAALPELVDAVKSSVRDLFHSGQVPGIAQYIDYTYITHGINESTQQLIKTAINELSVDKDWLKKVEGQINQNMTQRVVATLGAMDINGLIRDRVDEITEKVVKKIWPGIQDQATKVELTILDENVIVENTFVAKNINVVDTATVKDLVIKGSINTDSNAWKELTSVISKKTLDQLSDQWKDTLVKQVAEAIKQQGIEFDSVTINGRKIIDDNTLSSYITQSNLQKVGELQNLVVRGEVNLNDTVNVVKSRLGVNTAEPDMALSVWDEEVSLSAGKYKQNIAYLGTSRKQGLTIGINKKPAVEITEDGLTAIKQLRVGVHRISHGNEVPNYSGTKGDIVFNADPGVDNPVFAWVCLGGFRWKVLKATD